MNEYELVFITKENGEEILKKIAGHITGKAGVVNSQETWGKKSFAYPINKNSVGYYFVWKFSTTPKEILPLKKTLQYDENILRYLLLKIK